MSVRVCLLCGADGRHATRLLDGVVSRCERCGFAWTTQGLGEVASLHDDNYFEDGGYDNYFRPEPRRFEAGVRMRWIRGFTELGSIIEAGSAGGYFVEAARASGIDATGVEISIAGSQYARETLNVPVVTSDFEALEPPRPVDAVCAFHVLEHVEDPQAFLAAARRHLAPGGWVFLEVPNFGSVAATRRGHDWPGLQPQFHRWHFDPDTLGRLVRDSGFDVVTVDTAVFRLYMPGRYRRRQARGLLFADLRNMRSLRLTHPRRGDLLRVVARRPAVRLEQT